MVYTFAPTADDAFPLHPTSYTGHITATCVSAHPCMLCTCMQHKAMAPHASAAPTQVHVFQPLLHARPKPRGAPYGLQQRAPQHTARPQPADGRRRQPMHVRWCGRWYTCSPGGAAQPPQRGMQPAPGHGPLGLIPIRPECYHKHMQRIDTVSTTSLYRTPARPPPSPLDHSAPPHSPLRQHRRRPLINTSTVS